MHKKSFGKLAARLTGFVFVLCKKSLDYSEKSPDYSEKLLDSVGDEIRK